MRDHVQHVVAEWLGRTRGAPIARLRIVRSPYSTSSGIYNVHVECVGGERRRLVYKRSERALKPAFVYSRDREEWIYREVLRDAPADAPDLLGAGGGSPGRRWLLLEWAGSVDLTQVGDRRIWREAARRLAEFHVWGESRVDQLSLGPVVRWDDPAFHRRWAQRARRFSTDPALARLLESYLKVIAHLAELPATLVHGDANASNVLVQRGLEVPPRIRFIDWELAGIGPGLLDLAMLVSGAWSDRDRKELIEAYRQSLGQSRLGVLSDADFNEALRICRLAVAVRWLGWAAEWAPPARQAHDWRADALSIGAELGLVDRAA